VEYFVEGELVLVLGLPFGVGPRRGQVGFEGGAGAAEVAEEVGEVEVDAEVVEGQELLDGLGGLVRRGGTWARKRSIWRTMVLYSWL
jgi:hypothetical protein